MYTMYLDTHEPVELVTTGIGNLIDPLSEALHLPWYVKGTIPPRLATKDEIEAEWNHVKSLTALAHSPSRVWSMVTKLYLTQEAVRSLVFAVLDQNEAELKARPCFANFDAWPADAQLGVLSMSWAMGTGFHFPLFESAVQRGAWSTAVLQCLMDDRHNPGLTPRNKANVLLFQNASKVAANSLDCSILHYPNKA
jgi:hypothetical protein